MYLSAILGAPDFLSRQMMTSTSPFKPFPLDGAFMPHVHRVLGGLISAFGLFEFGLDALTAIAHHRGGRPFDNDCQSSSQNARSSWQYAPIDLPGSLLIATGLSTSWRKAIGLP